MPIDEIRYLIIRKENQINTLLQSVVGKHNSSEEYQAILRRVIPIKQEVVELYNEIKRIESKEYSSALAAAKKFEPLPVVRKPTEVVAPAQAAFVRKPDSAAAAASSYPEFSNENRDFLTRVKAEMDSVDGRKKQNNFSPFQSRIGVPDAEGVDSSALLRHHAIDRILEENRRGYTPFPQETTAPTDPLEAESRLRSVDLARGVDRTSQRMTALQTIQDRVLKNAERHGQLSPEGKERLTYAGAVPDKRELLSEAKLDTEALMNLIQKRAYERYEYDKKNRQHDLDKRLTGRMALGKTWDSGDTKARQRFQDQEERVLKELRDNLDDTEKGIFRESLHNVHGRDNTARQRVMQGVDRELQGNAQGFNQDTSLAQTRRAQAESEYQNYLHRIRLLHDAGAEKRTRAQEIIAEQRRRFEEAKGHNTAQTNTLANILHGTPMPVMQPYVMPEPHQKHAQPRNQAIDLAGLGLQALGTFGQLSGGK